MAKFRPRMKGKGKRWKKGQSSSSNPTVTKYRDKARSNFFQENLGGPSLLTTEALHKHDAISGSRDVKPMEADIDEISVGASTFKTLETFATDFSGCTNVSYSKLMHQFDPNSAIQKEKLAVLAAISEVIKSNGGAENNTEYFAALMAMLESTDCEEMSVAAVLSLLAMGIKGVPQPVLQQRFSQCSKVFLDILAKYAESQNNIIYRGTLACLSVLLRNQASSVWKDSWTVKVFDTVLMFTVHSKPKVRKAAQQSVCALLRASPLIKALKENGKTELHPAAQITAEFCVRQIEKNGNLSSSTTTTLHILGLLKDVMGTFPKKHLKAACETILKVMTLGNVVVLSCGMQALHGLFVSRPSPTSLPAELNGQLITALYDYQPQSNDSQPTQAWLAVMQEAMINLSKLNLTLSVMNLPKLLTTAVSLWLTGKPEIMNAATLTMKACMEDCLTPAAEPEVLSTHQKQINAVIDLFKSTLGYKYHAVWSHVLHLFGVLFKACGKTCGERLMPCVKELADLRDSSVFSYMNELDFCVGNAVRSMGPELVLKAIPLQFSDDNKCDFKRSWLLPVLRENIQESTLIYFIENFIPLAVHCRNKSEWLKNQKDQVGALSYDLLQTQIWALLPSFCTRPKDITANFTKIAKELGRMLGTRKELRMSVMAALRKLILCSKEAQKENDLSEIGRFAKNYLPILFNIYTTSPEGSEEEGIRLAAIETIKVYLSLADASLCLELFKKAMTKLASENSDAFIKESVLDLLRALLPFQTKESICELYNSTVAKIQNIKIHKEEKKYYRLLEEICGSNSDGCSGFIKERMDQIRHLLLNSLSSSAPSSKGPRLRCLLHLLDRQEDGFEVEELIAQTVPEAIICCQDINSRCRGTAYEVVAKMADKMIASDKFEKYIEMVLAGLAGSPRCVSATLLALASIAYHCKESVTEDLLAILLNNVLLLLCSTTREIVRSALSFVKLYITSFDQDIIAPQLSQLMKALVNMTDDCKRHFRQKTRDILARLVRWYGADSILAMIPESETIMRVRVRNLRKIQDRKKKLRQQELEEKKSKTEDLQFSIKKKPKSIDEILAESDSDIGDDDDKPQKTEKKTKRNQKSKAWIQEDAEDFMDFTASEANRKITTTKPEKKNDGFVPIETGKKNKNKDKGFKTAPDGRLIITGSDDENDDSNVRRRRREVLVDSDEDDYDDEDDTDTKSVGSSKTVNGGPRKRRLSMSSLGSALPAVKYQAGGSGIHRPIHQTGAKIDKKLNPGKKKSKDFGTDYRSKKAKGDVKKKGMPDPYAYLPLERSMLNRRKKMKAAGQFKNIVRSARKGAKIGRIKLKRLNKT